MDFAVGGDNILAFCAPFLVFAVGDAAAGFADQKGAGHVVPGARADNDYCIGAAACDIGVFNAGAAKPAVHPAFAGYFFNNIRAGKPFLLAVSVTKLDK